MKEIWKDIEGWEGYYQISNIGRVKSLARMILGSNGQIYHVKERILKPHLDKKGYYTIMFHKNHERKPKLIYVHRLVAQAFVENPNNYEVVNHKDCNTINNKSDNLEWCTQKENVQYGHKLNRYLSTCGTNNWKNKLSENQVRWIRKNYDPNNKSFCNCALMRLFNVTDTCIYDIVNYRNWKNLSLYD